MSWGLCKETSTICSGGVLLGLWFSVLEGYLGLGHSHGPGQGHAQINVLVIQKPGHVQEHPLRFIKKKKPIGTWKYVRNCLEESSWSLVEPREQHATRRLHSRHQQGLQLPGVPERGYPAPSPVPLPKRQTLRCCDSFLKQLHRLAPGPRTALQGSTSHRL